MFCASHISIRSSQPLWVVKTHTHIYIFFYVLQKSSLFRCGFFYLRDVLIYSGLCSHFRHIKMTRNGCLSHSPCTSAWIFLLWSPFKQFSEIKALPFPPLFSRTSQIINLIKSGWGFFLGGGAEGFKTIMVSMSWSSKDNLSNTLFWIYSFTCLTAFSGLLYVVNL